MKKLRLLSLVGIASIALLQAGLAAGRGGGGGGFGGGGFGGGGGGHFGGGGGFHAGGFGGGHFGGGGGFSAPHVVSGGAINRGGGVGFAVPRRSFEPSSIPNRVTRGQPSIANRSQMPRSAVTNHTPGLTNSGRVNRTQTTSGRATAGPGRPQNRSGLAAARNGQASRAAAPRPSNEAAFNRDHHVFARENRDQHRDWDRRHAHFFNGHWFCWDGGFWIGLDDGFYPWDFYPYYASDYYPYDYYTDVEPVDQSYAAQQADPTVSAVQTDLAQLGYYNGPIDGLFGADTRTALTRYQIDEGLQVTGSLTTDTLQSLGLPQITSS